MSETITDISNVQLPTEPGWYWIKNPEFGRRAGAEEWTIVHINLLQSDFLHIKKGELVVGANRLETFARSSRVTEFVKIDEPGKEKPVDILLFCPNCGEQHIDSPEPEKNWSNPDHKSHECRRCFWTWRPSDTPTNGVAALKTRGKKDGDAKPCAIAVRRTSKKIRTDA